MSRLADYIEDQKEDQDQFEDRDGEHLDAEDEDMDYEELAAKREQLELQVESFWTEARTEFERLVADPAPRTVVKKSKNSWPASPFDAPLTSNSTLMTAAAARDDVAFMQALADAGASTTLPRPLDNASPMLCAIVAGAADSVAWLLDQDVPIDRLDETPDTPPLWHAVDHAREHIALLLVENGADLDYSIDSDPPQNILGLTVSRSLVRVALRIQQRLARRLLRSCRLFASHAVHFGHFLATTHCVLP